MVFPAAPQGQTETKEKPGVVITVPKSGKMWAGELEIRIRLKHIETKDIRQVEYYLDGRLIKEIETPPFHFVHSFGMRGHNRVLKVLVRGHNKKVMARTQLKSFQADDQQDVEVRRVMVPVVVKDKKGNYVRGLKQKDFILLSDDKPVKIAYFDAAGTTRFNMIQVVDISYSMRDKIHDVLEAATDFLKQLLTAKDRGAFVFFNHIVFDQTELTDDPKALVEDLFLKSPAAGGTAIFDALAYTLDLMSKTPGWNIVVIFSDGEDNSSYIDRPSLIQKVKKSAAVIYAIDNGISYGGKVLEQICDHSGGKTFPLDSVKKTQQIYERIREDIKARYILYFNPKGSSRNRFHSLTVKVKGKKYEIRTPKGYY
jgi:VWFA-related protein